MRPSLLPEDLRIRLVVVFLAVCIFSQLQTLETAFLACIGSLILGATERIERSLWRRLLHVEGFVLLIFITMPFLIPGTSLFSIGPLQASLEGLARAALIGCKVLGFCAAFDDLSGHHRTNPPWRGALMH